MAKTVEKNGLPAKEVHRFNLLEYLANPENPLMTRSNLAKEVLGMSTAALYKFFTTDEMTAIENEALNKRRARYSIKISQVDKALFEKAIDEKDVKAIELVYKKFENWNPNQKIEISTNDCLNDTLAELAKRLPE